MSYVYNIEVHVISRKEFHILILYYLPLGVFHKVITQGNTKKES